METLTFHSIQLVIFTTLESSTSQKRTMIVYKVDTGSKFNLMPLFFTHKAIHKKTWQSPDVEMKNEIDYICVSRGWRSALKDTWTLRGTDVGSNH